MAKMYGNYRPEVQNSGGWGKRSMRRREELQAMHDFREEDEMDEWDTLEPTPDELREVELETDEDLVILDDDTL